MPQARRDLKRAQLARARSMRKSSSVAEIVAWNAIRNRKLGFDFRRQHAVGPYVLDFYCAEAMLALEFDGEQHIAERDAIRDAEMAKRGILTFRIPNREFFFIDEPSTDWLREVIRVCEERTGRKRTADSGLPPPTPVGGGGGGRPPGRNPALLASSWVLV